MQSFACQSREELDRRLLRDADLDHHRAPAASLLRRIWQAQVEADLEAATD